MNLKHEVNMYYDMSFFNHITSFFCYSKMLRVKIILHFLPFSLFYVPKDEESNDNDDDK